MEYLRASGTDWGSTSFDDAATEVQIVVVGSEETNKAKFLAHYLGFDVIAEDPTGDYFTKAVQIQNESYLVHVHTNIGQEEWWGAFDRTMRAANGFIFLYKTSSRDSFNAFQREREKILLHKGDSKIPILIVACEDEESERQVSNEEGKKLADLFGYSFREFKMSSAENVNSLFEELLKTIKSFESGTYGKRNIYNEQSGVAHIFEICVCGEPFVGKTSLVKKLTTATYNEAYITTAEPYTQKHQLVVDKENVLIKIIDTSGQSFLENCTKEMESIATVQGFILVYSVTSKSSLYEVEKLRNKILTCKTDGSKTPILIVGNKTDSTLNRHVSVKEGEALAKRLGCLFAETSVKHSDPDALVTPLIRELINQYRTSFEGELDKQGSVWKQGRRLGGWKSGYLIIKDSYLTYTNEKQKGKKKQFLLDETINVQLGVVVDGKTKSNSEAKVKDHTYPFTITQTIPNKGTVSTCVAASSESEREAWIASIKANIAVSEVASGIIDEVTKAMVWDLINTKGGPSLRRRPPSAVTPPSPKPRPASAISVSSPHSPYSPSDSNSESPRLFRRLSEYHFNSVPNSPTAKEEVVRTLRRSASSYLDHDSSLRERSYTLKEKAFGQIKRVSMGTISAKRRSAYSGILKAENSIDDNTVISLL